LAEDNKGERQTFYGKTTPASPKGRGEGITIYKKKCGGGGAGAGKHNQGKRHAKTERQTSYRGVNGQKTKKWTDAGNFRDFIRGGKNQRWSKGVNHLDAFGRDNHRKSGMEIAGPRGEKGIY